MTFDYLFDDFINVAAGIDAPMRPVRQGEQRRFDRLRAAYAKIPDVRPPIAPELLSTPRKLYVDR